MTTHGRSLEGSGTTEFERDLRVVLGMRALERAPMTLHASIRVAVAERAGILARIRLAFARQHAERRGWHSTAFAAMSVAIAVVAVVAVSVATSSTPGKDDQSHGQTRAASGPSLTPFAAFESPLTPTAGGATNRPTATPRSRVTPTPVATAGEATCRPAGPVLPWRDRPDPLDPGQPLADAGLHGMPAKQAAQLLRARNYCYTFKISTTVWCVTPNGTVRDLAYGPAGELIVWVRPYPMKTFDLNKVPPSGC